jgi:hypothetical protein
VFQVLVLLSKTMSKDLFRGPYALMLIWFDKQVWGGETFISSVEMIFILWK